MVGQGCQSRPNHPPVTCRKKRFLRNRGTAHSGSCNFQTLPSSSALYSDPCHGRCLPIRRCIQVYGCMRCKSPCRPPCACFDETTSFNGPPHLNRTITKNRTSNPVHWPPGATPEVLSAYHLEDSSKCIVRWFRVCRTELPRCRLQWLRWCRCRRLWIRRCVWCVQSWWIAGRIPALEVQSLPRFLCVYRWA